MTISIGKLSQRVIYTRVKPSKFTITWCGTITQIIGAFLVASGIFFYGYVFFAIGACCWLTFAKRTNNNALLLLESVFLSSNFLGLYNFF